MITYLIVNGNKKNSKKLEKSFSSFGEHICLGIVNNYDSALKIIIKEKPTILFINVDSEDSFEFIKEIKTLSCSLNFIVGVSSSATNCYNALKNNFFDYLLTPLNEIDLLKCFLKISKNKNFTSKRNVCLKSYNDFQYLNTTNILFLKADNNTTDFYMVSGDKKTAFKTLKTYEEILPNNFLRVHKSYIINTDYVNRINFGKSVCVINNEINIPFSDKYHSKIIALNKRLTNQSFISMNSPYS